MFVSGHIKVRVIQLLQMSKQQFKKQSGFLQDALLFEKFDQEDKKHIKAIEIQKDILETLKRQL